MPATLPTNRAAATFRTLGDDKRFQVLCAVLLQDPAPATVLGLAHMTDLHPTTIRAHLTRLTDHRLLAAAAGGWRPTPLGVELVDVAVRILNARS